METKVSTKELLIGFGIGLVVGVVTALLSAPMKGKILRQEVIKKSRDLKNRLIKSKVDSIHK